MLDLRHCICLGRHHGPCASCVMVRVRRRRRVRTGVGSVSLHRSRWRVAGPSRRLGTSGLSRYRILML